MREYTVKAVISMFLIALIILNFPMTFSRLNRNHSIDYMI